KRVIAHVLDRGSDTLPTPKSFNTLLGLTKTINDQLEETHRYFIAEMDAYNPGEIRTMCDLVTPSISVLTAVGPAHLERFGSIDRIVDALVEVVDGTRNDGVAVVYAGGEFGRIAVERSRALGRRVVTYADERDGAEADVIVSDVTVGSSGTRFRLRWQQHELDKAVHISLLGRHQALNGAAALIVARELDRDLDEAITKLAGVPNVEHRLQVVPTTNGVTVIDDSYNAN